MMAERLFPLCLECGGRKEEGGRSGRHFDPFEYHMDLCNESHLSSQLSCMAKTLAFDFTHKLFYQIFALIHLNIIWIYVMSRICPASCLAWQKLYHLTLHTNCSTKFLHTALNYRHH